MATLFDHQLTTTQDSASVVKDGDYIALPLGDLEAGEMPFDVYLKTKSGGSGELQYIVCCPRGAIFEASWIDTLQKKGLSNSYFHKNDLSRVIEYLHHNLRQALQDKNFPPKQKATKVYDLTILWVQRFFTEQQAQLGAQIKMGYECIDLLIDCIQQEQYIYSWLIELCRSNSFLYAHCLNTCLIGMTFVKSLGWQDRKMRDFGLGILLHDIGMTKVPISLMQKPTRLAEDELEQIKRHVTIGYHLLKAFSVLGQEALLMVLQHHESGDGSGYPEGLKLAAIHPWARILRIIDSYEALTSRRSWRQAIEPPKALRIMLEEWRTGTLFDAYYLEAFIKFLSKE